MSVSLDSAALSTNDDGTALLSSSILDFCGNVRKNDPSILPEVGRPFQIRLLSEREGIELSDALLENYSVSYLELETTKYTKSFAAAMAKYVRTSKHLQHICCYPADQGMRHYEELLCCFLPAFQESTSLTELHMVLPLRGGPSNLAFENMLEYAQPLQSLRLVCQSSLLEECAVAAASSGLKKNITLRELTLELHQGSTVSPILASLRDHPLLQRLCAWVCNGSDRTRDFVTKRHLKNHGT
jgi:hypothetical protein